MFGLVRFGLVRFGLVRFWFGKVWLIKKKNDKILPQKNGKNGKIEKKL